MGSEDRKPSASADEQYQHIPDVSFPTAAISQQGTLPGSERIEEPSYQEHGGNLSGQLPVEAPSFYPVDLFDRQLREERWQTPQVQPQQKNGAYPSSRGEQAYGALPPVPVALPQQGPVQYMPNRQYPQSPQYGPNSQQYRAAPFLYTNPQAYQHPSSGYIQQSQPPGYPYQGYYAPNGYQHRGYPGSSPVSPMYPYAGYPPRPRRNGYQLGMAITSLVGSILVILGGLLCAILLLGTSLEPIPTSSTLLAARFASMILMTALMLAGIVGGAFGVFHSSVALAGRPSRSFKLPPFWSFLPAYIVLVVVGLLVGADDAIINNLLLVFSLIALSAILPALTFFALALQQVRRPKTYEWPTTWRRLTLALVSGATSAIFLALIFEGVLTLIAVFQFGGANPSMIDNPSAPTPHDPRMIIFLLTLVSVIAPIVEEGFKPLAVVTLIGRVRSAAEAFILGMACGIGFDIVETTAYIGRGYQSWVNVAIDRSTAGLLHGFGAGMVALGWYYITHKDALKRNHLQIGLGCMLYAVLQHAIWNGSFVLVLLPSPIGPFLETGKIPIFGYQLDAFLIVYILLSVLIFCVLWFVTGKIRFQPDAPLGNKSKPGNQTNQAPLG